MNTLNTQLHGISKGLKYGDFNIPDLGEIIPASLMIQDLDELRPTGCSYMNNWGCEHLGTSPDEINQMGESYYERYFLRDEIDIIFKRVNNYLITGDFDSQCNFFQRVKLNKNEEYTWFYTVLKVVAIKQNEQSEKKIIVLSSPVIGLDHLVSKVNKTLDQDQFIKKHYRKFAELTVREKEIIAHLANGKSSNEIAEQLFISAHTVSTHRKNIIRKIECNSFADLLRFAIAFDLV